MVKTRNLVSHKSMELKIMLKTIENYFMQVKFSIDQHKYLEKQYSTSIQLMLKLEIKIVKIKDHPF